MAIPDFQPYCGMPYATHIYSTNEKRKFGIDDIPGHIRILSSKPSRAEIQKIAIKRSREKRTEAELKVASTRAKRYQERRKLEMQQKIDMAELERNSK